MRVFTAKNYPPEEHPAGRNTKYVTSNFEHLISDPFVIQRSRKLNPRVTLNIGGERHDVMWATLQKIPNSRLCKLANVKTHFEILVNLLNF